jgi:uroporphyrin-III C-methyltransferase
MSAQPATPDLAAPSKLTLFLIAACAGSVLVTGMLWSKLNRIQDTLARQSADATEQAVEAKTVARSAQDAVREAIARQSMMEAKLSEVSLQRSQLEELMQSLSRSRDENLVVDIESAVRLAQQQANLTGSAEPLLAALRAADQRIARAAQPRLNPLQRSIAKDIERIQASALADTPGLLVKLDELSRLADALPLANDVVQPAAAKYSPAPAITAAKPVAKSSSKAGTKSAYKEPLDAPTPEPSTWADLPQWLQRFATTSRDEILGLVRVSSINTPEAALLSPEQGFFVRENLKLKILNARLGLLARQADASRADLAQASASLTRYFDANARDTVQAQQLLTQLQNQMRSLELPRIDDTMAALATAAAGR